MSHYFTLNTISEVMCLSFAIVYLLNDTSLIWRSMILYMLITCIVEFLGIYVERSGHFNYWVYNVFLIFEAGFTMLMFAGLFKGYHQSKFVIIGVVTFIILYVCELIRHGFFIYYNNFTYTVMSVLYVLYGLYYYYLMIRDDNPIDIKYSPVFWWVAGTVFFYFGNTACNLFSIQFGSVKIYQQLSYIIFKVLNVILYGCWSYSFICKKWATTKFKASLS